MGRALAVLVGALICAVAAAPAALASADVRRLGDGESAVVSWGGREHRDRTSLEFWLLARGVRYETWAERHPGAAGRIDAPPGADAPLDAVVAPPSNRGSSLPAVLAAVAVALGLALLGCAALFASTWAREGRRAPRLILALHHGALEIAGAGVVLVVAALTGYLLAL